MSHILFAWEYGEDLGHLTRIAVVAQELIARNHKVTVAVKDLSRAGLFFENSAVEVMQAPVWLPRPRRPRLTKTIADILAYRGYGATDGLTMLVQAWSGLLRATKPDVIVCDYAPTAQIAAGRYQIPRVVLSNSFSFPEPGEPGRDICPWIEAPVEMVRHNEQTIINNINKVASSLDFPGIRHLPDIFAHEAAFITELPMFDRYKNSRLGATYVGPAPSQHDFETADWGNKQGPRVFVYLKPGRPKVDGLLKVLRSSETVVRGFFPGQLPDGLQHNQDGYFKLSKRPLNLMASMKNADVAIFHGGIGTVCDVVLSGKPMLTLPTQIEQTFNSRLIQRTGHGDWIAQQQGEDELKQRLQNVLTSTPMRTKAEELAAQHAEFKDFPFSRTICDGIEDL